MGACLLIKVSAAPEEEMCFMGETKINMASGEPENKNTRSKVIKRFCIKR